MNATALAERLRKATDERAPLGKITDEIAGFSVADGYAVQAAGIEMALGRGEKLVGYKMGLTSRAKQRDVNVHEPIRGCLLASMEFLPGADVPASKRIHPRAEPEIAVTLKTPLRGPGVTLRHVIAALDGVYLAMEILDSRFDGYKFNLPDVIADNTSASGFLVGQRNWLGALERVRLLGVTLRRNGEIVDTGAPAATLGDPLLSVAALANTLGADGRELAAGQVILTGGITAAIPFEAGDWIEASAGGETLGFRAV